MMKTIPETLEACKAELKAIYEKKAWLLFCLLMIAFLLGLTLGVQNGYHQALVDFKIIAGTVI